MDVKSLAQFMYGDTLTNQGFWYSHVLWEVRGLEEEQLYWVPDPNSLCLLWQVGHIAHRERLHIGVFLQGLSESIIPGEFNVFGAEWAAVDQVRQAVSSPQVVFDWVRQVRQESRAYIASLDEADFWEVPPFSEGGLSTAHWLYITACHTSLHIGRIQMLRAMIEGVHERAC